MRRVSVPAARLGRWVTGFGERHQGFEFRSAATGFTLAGGDGEVAEVALPYLPWPGGDLAAALAHLSAVRRSHVVVVRRGGYACATVEAGAVVASKVGSRYVQGRTAAGGWSQQRFARRRANQAAELVEAAAAVAARLLQPRAGDWLATGGDRDLLGRLLQQPSLARLTALPHGPHLAVGDPGRALVQQLPELLTTVTVTLSS